MMSEKQAAFRESFRDNIEKWYSGPLHVFSIYAIGVAGIVAFATAMTGTRWWDWLVVIPVFLGCNVFEWYLHKRTMHRRVKGLGAIYQRHTINHHQFFTIEEMRIDRIRDYRIVFFPPYALVAFMVLSILPAAIAWALISASAGWIVMITTTAFYLNYELFHLSCHVEERPYLRTLPFINTIRRHHEVHHNQRVMTDTNLNLTYPIADWLFGTSDLDRGLWGTSSTVTRARTSSKAWLRPRASARWSRPPRPRGSTATRSWLPPRQPPLWRGEARAGAQFLPRPPAPRFPFRSVRPRPAA